MLQRWLKSNSISKFLLNFHNKGPGPAFIFNECSRTEAPKNKLIVNLSNTDKIVLEINYKIMNKNFISTGLYKLKEEFYKWFVGFADAESSFSIVPRTNVKGIISSFSFVFSIRLHIDDIEVLNYKAPGLRTSAAGPRPPKKFKYR